MVKFLKALRVKSDLLQQNLLYFRTKRAMQHWHQRLEWTKTLRRRNAQILEKRRKRLATLVIGSWKKILTSEHISLARMSRLLSKM